MSADLITESVDIPTAEQRNVKKLRHFARRRRLCFRHDPADGAACRSLAGTFNVLVANVPNKRVLHRPGPSHEYGNDSGIDRPPR